MQEIDAKEWQEKIASDTNAIVLDVRTDEEVEQGVIPGAKQINIAEPAGFMEKATQLDKSKNYYIYCRSGRRSAQACVVLESIGVKNTFNLLGGIEDWDGPIE